MGLNGEIYILVRIEKEHVHKYIESCPSKDRCECKSLLKAQLAMVRSLISLVIAGIQLELRAIPPFFCTPLSLGLIDLALTPLPSNLLFFNISLMASAWNKTG